MGGPYLTNKFAVKSTALPWQAREGGKALRFHNDRRKSHHATAFFNCTQENADSLSLSNVLSKNTEAFILLVCMAAFFKDDMTVSEHFGKRTKKIHLHCLSD